jgi:magnesium chelatase family protein
VQYQRQKKTNHHMSAKEIKQFCVLDGASKELLATAFEEMNLSVRSHDRILKVARTIADLDHSLHILQEHLMEALTYRSNVVSGG